MNNLKKLILTAAIFFAAINIFAQSSDVISKILEKSEVTFGDVCYLSAVHQQLADDSVSYKKAVEVLYEAGQLPSDNLTEELIPAVDLAYLYARMWGIKGGLMFRLTHGSPRYAFKQLQADKIIPQNIDPSDYVSGAQLLSFYSACLRKYASFDINSDSMAEDSTGEAE